MRKLGRFSGRYSGIASPSLDSLRRILESFGVPTAKLPKISFKADFLRDKKHNSISWIA